MSANELAIGPVVAVAVARTVERVDGGADCAGAGIVEPATMRPTRKDTVATRQTVTSRNRRGIVHIIEGFRLWTLGFGLFAVAFEQRLKLLLVQHRHTEVAGLVGLAPGLCPNNDARRLLAD